MSAFPQGPGNLPERGNMISGHTVLVTLALGAIYIVCLVLYRCYFHPLAKFPGPLMAAISTRWLYRTLMTGHAEEVFERLHAQYNTRTLRISPNELHISDPQQYKVIYSQTNPFPKDAAFYDAFNVPHAVFAETNPQLHKERRELLRPFFSRVTLLKIEDLIHQRARVLVEKLARLSKSKDSINIIQAIRCLIFDVTLRFSFADSSNLLEEEFESFDSSIVRPFDCLSGRLFTNIEWPIWTKAVKSAPKALRQLIYPQGSQFAEIISIAQRCIANYELHNNTTSHPVIFDCLSSLPPDQKLSEAIDMLFAGSDTTATSLTTGILYILLDPKIHKKLVDALREIRPDEKGEFPLQHLEDVPYLTACVKESLRIAAAIPGRLPRVVPGNTAEPFMVDGRLIPEGTIVSISAYTMHFSEGLWGADARKFNPDRWLQPQSKDLNQYFCTFSKGRRMCLGQNLASAEMTILLVYLFKNFELSLPTNFSMPEIQDVYVNRFPTGLPVRIEKI